MRLLLPRNLGAVERVSLPWDSPGGCGGISSVEGYQFSRDCQVPDHQFPVDYQGFSSPGNTGRAFVEVSELWRRGYQEGIDCPGDW